MPSHQRQPDSDVLTVNRRTPRRTWIAALAVVTLTAGAGLLGFALRQPDRTTNSRDTSATTVPTAAPTSQQDVVWQAVAGVRIPFSRLHGPRITSAGQAGGYSRSQEGAALAAVQVLIRTSPSVGPAVFSPVLATQVTGADLPALKLATTDEYERLRAQAGTAAGQPIPSTDAAQVLGYVVHAYAPADEASSVDVVVTSPSLGAGRTVAFRVLLRWQRDDWQVVAPPRGDWGAVATTLGAPPAGLVEYGG